MKTILQINKPESIAKLSKRQLVRSLLIFSVTFVTLFLLPMLGRTTSLSGRNLERRYERTSDWMEFLAENPLISVGICLLVVLLYNVFQHFKNRQKKYVRSIMIGNSTIIIELTDMYFTRNELISIPVNKLLCVIGVRNRSNQKKQHNVKFVNKITGETVALLPLYAETWFRQYLEIREALSKLSKLGVEHKEISVGFTDSIRDTVS